MPKVNSAALCTAFQDHKQEGNKHEAQPQNRHWLILQESSGTQENTSGGAWDTGWDTDWYTSWDTGWEIGWDTGWDTGWETGWETGWDTGKDTVWLIHNAALIGHRGEYILYISGWGAELTHRTG